MNGLSESKEIYFKSLISRNIYNKTKKLWNERKVMTHQTNALRMEFGEYKLLYI